MGSTTSPCRKVLGLVYSLQKSRIIVSCRSTIRCIEGIKYLYFRFIRPGCGFEYEYEWIGLRGCKPDWV